MVAFGKSLGGGRRVGKREAAPLVAVLTTRTQCYKGLLVDVSASGARVRGPELPAADEEVMLAAEKVRTFGRVRWTEGGRCGLAFDEPLTAAEVSSLRHEVAKCRGLPPELKAASDEWELGTGR